MLCESVPEVLGKEIFKFRQCNLTISLLYPLKKRATRHLNKLQFLYVPILAEIGPGKEDENVKSLQTGGRADGRQAIRNGRQAIRKGNQRFQLRCASKEINFFSSIW